MANNIISVVIDLLKSDSYITSLVSDRIYPEILPKNFILPAITVSRSGGVGGVEKIPYDNARIQIQIFSKVLLEGLDIYEKRFADKTHKGINPLLHRKYNYQFNDYIIYRSIRTSGLDTLFDDENLIYVLTTFFEFKYKDIN